MTPDSGTLRKSISQYPAEVSTLTETWESFLTVGDQRSMTAECILGLDFLLL